jgi:hypothetical protein
VSKSRNAGGAKALSRSTAAPQGVVYPANEAGVLMRFLDEAVQEVACDPAVWIEEAQRESATPLPWPLAPGKGHVGLLRILAAEVVDCVLAAMSEADGIAPNADAADADFQIVLRVVARVIQLFDRKAIDSFGGTGRIPVKRDWVNFLRERDVMAAMQLASRSARAAALKDAGISKAAASRARKRALNTRR